MILKSFSKGKKKQRKLAEEKYSAIEKYIGDNLEHDGLFDDAPTNLELHSSFEEYAKKAYLEDVLETPLTSIKEERFEKAETFDFLIEEENLRAEIIPEEDLAVKLREEIVLDKKEEAGL